MYVGSTRPRSIEEYVATPIGESEYKISKENITFSPAILRIFIEPLSNAIDNAERSKKTNTPCTKIKVNINFETYETTIWNDGDIIPIEIDHDEKCYNHTMIFGQLLTGSNYDDNEERIISGRNGLGAKCCNVFSEYFMVKAVDPATHKSFKQRWDNNMKNVSDPQVKSVVATKGFTEVKWKPDFKQFHVAGYTNDIIRLYIRYVIDAALLTKVKVYFNDVLLKVPNLLSYSYFYDPSITEYIQINDKTCSVLVTPSSEFQVVSFVNGVYTRLGGHHVDAWTEAIFRPIVNKFNKKNKPQISIKDVRQFFRLFIVAYVPNPEFDGQDKHKLESPSVTASLKTSYLNKILKWSIMENISDIIRSKEMMLMRKVERKRKGFTKIEGMDPANNAGTKYSMDCTLIICEGLSAKTYAVAGIQQGAYNKSGRDWWGIYPLRGKALNVRNASSSAIAKNRETTDIIKAIGLKYNIDYSKNDNFKQLRYGKVMIMTDADTDGIHIEGLVMNMFHSLFPSLMQREQPFIVSMKTPIVRVFRPTGDLLFYDERKFKEYSKSQNKNFKMKYYKGLGTTKPEDVKDTFGLKMVEYVNDDATTTNMNKVFHKKYADSRKEWLENYDPASSMSLDDVGNIHKMNISQFMDSEMIKFSIEDCKRSLPSCMDGLKESQRKILYAVKKRKLKFSGQSLKVAQLSGYVAEHTNYHHGEQNLFETITKMAHDFPGSNNIPLLFRDGMFGTRLSNGKDAASARYIYTKMDMLTSLLFREEDDILLDQVLDDGDLVEPHFYMPILPLILINGCTGIGTGWSCNIPCYNPLDLIQCVKIWLEKDGKLRHTIGDTVFSSLPKLVPWYRGFKGDIEAYDDKFITKGVCTSLKNDKVVVSEIPIGMSIDKFKNSCEDLVESKLVKGMKNYSNPNKPEFVISESLNGIKCDTNTLKLHSYLYVSNMVLFNEKGVLCKFNNVEDIICYFCNIRFQYYIKRKQHVLKLLKKDLSFLKNKSKFIKDVMSRKLTVMFEDEDVVIENLVKFGYDKCDDSYEYLLKMPIRTFTKDKVTHLLQSISVLEKKIIEVDKTSEKQMWLNDLDAFEKEYTKWIRIMEKTSMKKN
jgi:DNA topoisomerase-2